MYNIIGITLVVLLMTLGTSASQQSDTATLEKEFKTKPSLEHGEPGSLVSILPKDIVESTKSYLDVCPVALTLNNDVLDKVPAFPSSRWSKVDLSDINKARKDFHHMQTYPKFPRIIYIFKINDKDYYYQADGGFAVSNNAFFDNRDDHTLKEVFIKENESPTLRGVLVDVKENPQKHSQRCVYEGFKKDAYYFKFNVLFKGEDDPWINEWLGNVARRTHSMERLAK